MLLKGKFLMVVSLSLLSVVAIFCFLFLFQKNYPFLLSIGGEKILTLLHPHDPSLFLEIGNNYFGRGKEYDIDKAEEAYRKALDLNPNFLEAHYQLGRIYFINGELDEAFAEINTVLEINPEYKKGYYMYGLISGYARNFEEAAYGFSEFIKRDDFNWAGYNDLAWVYFKQGDYEKTRETAEKGLSKAPNNPWLNNIYGTALLNLNRTDEAKKAFEIALEEANKLSPEDWGKSYPGNNPEIYARGLEETRAVIRHNLEIVSE